MKLNSRRTILTGLAFLSICAFWQMYDNVIPLILTKTFHMNETLSGAIMAADNILALFLLPFFGARSDKTNTKIGKRMPYILFGTGCAVILMNLLPLIDNSYAAAPSSFKTVSFVIVLGLLLIAMGTYRSPAVALMPDLTPKPLRSRANAIINLMGAVGGMVYLGVAAILYSQKRLDAIGLTKADRLDYQPLFLIVSAIMFVSVGVLFLKIKEPKLTKETQELEAQHPEWNLAETDASGHEVLPKPVKKSLGFLLASIALWFAGYNGVTTWFTTYVASVTARASAALLRAFSSRPAAQSSPTFLSARWPPKSGARRPSSWAYFYLPHALRSAMCSRRAFLPSTPSCSSSSRSWGLPGRPSTSTPFRWSSRCAGAQISASLPATTTPPAWPRRS